MEEDLGIKIGSPLEVLWTNVKKEAEFLIKQSEDSLVIQRAMRELAENRITEEKAKI